MKLFWTIMLFSLVASGVYFFTKKETESQDRIESIVVVKKGDVVVKAAETGSLEPTQIVEIKSEQAGEVKHLFVESGDKVAVGDPLATIQQESSQARKVAEARAAIEQEQLNLDEATREHHRMKALLAKGFVAKKEVEGAKKQYENAQIRFDLSKRNLLLTLGGNKILFEKYLRQTDGSDVLDDFTIYSPLSGRVLEVNVAVGEIVSSGTSTVTGGTALMHVADLSNMWVKTKINEVNIGQIAEGQAVQIQLDAIQEKVYTGRVVKISPKGEKENDIVTYEVTIELENSDQRLMPSMTANVDIITDIEKEVLYLPLIALDEADGKTRVHLKNVNGGSRLQNVVVGLKNESVVVIKEGLQEGDRIVLPEPVKKTETRPLRQ